MGFPGVFPDPAAGFEIVVHGLPKGVPESFYGIGMKTDSIVDSGNVSEKQAVIVVVVYPDNFKN